MYDLEKCKKKSNYLGQTLKKIQNKKNMWTVSRDSKMWRA